MPPLPTLLANAPWQTLCDMGPISRARCCHDLSEDLVFLLGPGALRKVTAIVELEPSRVALDLRLARKELADAIPAILAKPFDIAHQFRVLN